MSRINTTKLKRETRHKRIRAKVHGTAERPRLCVYRSNKFCYAQLIDDEKGLTLFSASDKSLPVAEKKLKKIERAGAIGKILAELAVAGGIKATVFDRGGFIYAGRVRALAEGARAGGLKL